MDVDMSDYFVAIGTSEGGIKIVDIESGLKKKDIQTQERISALRFSPNKDFLAVGHWTGTLSIYLTQDWELMRHIKAYSPEIFVNCAIFCIDWTEDSTSIQTENKSRDYKLLEVNGSYINEITTRSIGMNTKNWKTQSCLESWKVSGVIPSKYLLDESKV
jgi:WD40 repeat protein